MDNLEPNSPSTSPDSTESDSDDDPQYRENTGTLQYSQWANDMEGRGRLISTFLIAAASNAGSAAQSFNRDAIKSPDFTSSRDFHHRAQSSITNQELSALNQVQITSNQTKQHALSEKSFVFSRPTQSLSRMAEHPEDSALQIYLQKQNELIPQSAPSSAQSNKPKPEQPLPVKSRSKPSSRKSSPSPAIEFPDSVFSELAQKLPQNPINLHDTQNTLQTSKGGLNLSGDPELEFSKVEISKPSIPPSPESISVCKSLSQAVTLRNYFMFDSSVIPEPNISSSETPDELPPYEPFSGPLLSNSDHVFVLGHDGVFHVWENEKAQNIDLKCVACAQIGHQKQHLRHVNSSGPSQSKSSIPKQKSSESLSTLSDLPIFSPSNSHQKHHLSVYQNESFPVITFKSYRKSYQFLRNLITFGPAKTFCFKRLLLLENKYKIHKLLNDDVELWSNKAVYHRDFYTVRKVDVHIHLSAAMNQKHLLKFIKNKLTTDPDKKVIVRDGKELSLKEVFESLGLTAYQLNIDTLDCHANNATFHRFDRFNLKYNPVGESRLREIFLKYNNHIKGVYLAEIIQELIKKIEYSKYIHLEPRVSIYGREITEWQKLSEWIFDNKLFSSNVRWMIQIPRIYSIHKKYGKLECFAQMINNIFQPLFLATKNPSKYPKLSYFLQQVVAFDSVDDESKRDKRIHHPPRPDEWNTADNPPYWYYTYFFYANLTVLNQFRKSRGLNTFSFRPHSGEAGDLDHLCATFLTAQSINHGIQLRKSPVLQYLYYLSQIGLAMSPLSNNSLFIRYEKNPFPVFFARGMNCTLSTDDPLQFHLSREPLIEEYAICRQVWKLSPTDICEVARNSVMISNFDHNVKQRWLGKYYQLPRAYGNDITLSNVPNIRLIYRYDTLNSEITFIDRAAKYQIDKSTMTISVPNLPQMLKYSSGKERVVNQARPLYQALRRIQTLHPNED